MSIKAAACALVICLGSSAALAQPAPGADPMAKLGPVLPPQQIARILRTNGFVPQATPVRNGEAYQVRALDRMGRQVRVAVDARYGDILVVRPIAMAPSGVYGPPPAYYGAPPPYYYGGAYPPSPGVRPLPPPGQSAALTPVHPPLPRPKPVAKPAAVAPAPATAPEATPPAAAPATAPAAEAPAAAPAPPPAVPAPPAAVPPIPPVAPLE